MKAYHGDGALKEKMIAQVRNHQEQDKIIQGTYGAHGEEFRGCAVGCALHSLSLIHGKQYALQDHWSFEPLFGIPVWVARLLDYMFEGLPVSEARLFPLQAVKAIPVGADLERVKGPFLLYILGRAKERASGKPDLIRVIDRVIELWTKRAAGEAVSDTEFYAARRDAVRVRDAYWSADAAAAAADADAAAAADADAAAAFWTTRRKVWGEIRDEFLRLLRECPQAAE